MIQPTEADVGRAVEYRDRGHFGAPEQGVLVSFNELYAFVRYGRDAHAKATAFGDLDWIKRPTRRRT